jgi:hypothetical protein
VAPQEGFPAIENALMPFNPKAMSFLNGNKEVSRSSFPFAIERRLSIENLSFVFTCRIKDPVSERVDSLEGKEEVILMALAQRKKTEEKPDFQEMMEVWKKLAIPGEPHRLLASRVGSWSTKSKHWMEHDKPPMEFAGSCERRMILGGRFLQDEFSGEMMGSPFTGIGVIGYDNHTKKYVSTWMDSMGTGIYFFEGTAGRDGKTLSLESRFDDPVKGPGTWRLVTRFVDENTEVAEMKMSYDSGVEEKCETTYTRKH